MEMILSHTVGLLVVAIFVAMIARRFRLPYTVGLVITGIGLALTRVETEATLTHDFIFDVILPPLLFEAAISIHWSELRRDALPVLTLATLGVVISAAVVAAGMVSLSRLADLLRSGLRRPYRGDRSGCRHSDVHRYRRQGASATTR